MHFLKKGQKIRAWVDPPLIRAMPERKRFFFIELFTYVEQERKPANIWFLAKHIKKCNSCLSQEAISQAKISVRALFSSLVCQGSPLLPLPCLSHASIISYISPVLSLCHSKAPPPPLYA